MAGEKKKVKNKQNCVPSKKQSLQQVNYTEELATPVSGTLDVKSMNRSIELKKPISTKKSVSRKSGCTSVKQSVKQQSSTGLKYRQLLRKFDQLKGFHERGQRSKSRSTKQITTKEKSRSPKIKPSGSKKFNLTQLMGHNVGTKIRYYTTANHKTEFNSRMSLTNKLEKTLTKINENDYLDRSGDESLIPFVSTSEHYNNDEQRGSVFPVEGYFFEAACDQEDECINIGEMRKFCRTMENEDGQETHLKKNVGYFKGDRYEMMATRIQRAWRRYCTKRLVDRYADVFYGQYGGVRDDRIKSPYKLLHEKKHRFDESSSGEIERYQQQLVRKIERPYRERSRQSEEESYGMIFRVEDELGSSFEEGSVIGSGDVHEQEQQCNQTDVGNILNSSLLYPHSGHIEEQRMVTYISNLSDEQQVSQVHLQYHTIEYDDDEKHRQEESHRESLQNKNEQTQRNKSIAQNDEQQTKRIKTEGETEFIIGQIRGKELEEEEVQENRNVSMEQQEQSPQKLPPLEQTDFRIGNMQLVQNQPTLQPSSLQVPPINRHSSKPSSELSDNKKQQEFDSRKYIQYLDSDMYYDVEGKEKDQNAVSVVVRKGISLNKQKKLLAMLDLESEEHLIRRKVFGHGVSKSESFGYILSDYEASSQPSPSPINTVSSRVTRHKKSLSSHNIAMRSISPLQQQDELNLQLIRQEFLQGETVMEFEKLHSSQELRMKLGESDEEPMQPIVRVGIDLNRAFGIGGGREGNDGEIKEREYDGDGKIVTLNDRNQDITSCGPFNRVQTATNQPTAFSLSRPLPSTTTQPPSKPFIEHIDKSISSSQQSSLEHQPQEPTPQQSSKLHEQKLQNVSFMIYNTMILQTLRDIASCDAVLERFKEYSLMVKQAIKECKKGFQTNHTEVKSYVDGLVTYLLNQQPQVFKNLEVPAGPPALQMLHYMHPHDQQSQMAESSTIQKDQSSVLVIPSRVFDQYWEVRQKTMKFDIQAAIHINVQRKKRIVWELKNLMKMFYRCIFDTFNECLDSERNFGQGGRPYPWKRTPAFQHTKTLTSIQTSIANAQKKMTEIGTTYCGLIIEKSEMAKIALQGSDDYIQHVQEDRMSRMLAQDLIQSEEMWTFYDDEQLELLVEVSNFVAVSLIVELAGELMVVADRDR